MGKEVDAHSVYVFLGLFLCQASDGLSKFRALSLVVFLINVYLITLARRGWEWEAASFAASPAALLSFGGSHSALSNVWLTLVVMLCLFIL